MPEFDIGQVDKNLKVVCNPELKDAIFRNVCLPPFFVYGLYPPDEAGGFHRLPTKVADATSDGVKQLNFHTAGGRIRFATDSAYVAIKVKMPYVTHFSHMALIGTSGLDLYETTPDGTVTRFSGVFMPPNNMTDGYEAVLHLNGGKKLRYLTLHFPLYNPVDELYVGLQEDAKLLPGLPYRNQKPVVYYGSSITQGGCASRPGSCYTALVSRELNLHYLNLGFSGSGRAEDAIVDYMAGLDMSVFVSDYDHNAPDPEYLRTTHFKMYEKIRAKHPELPYIMVSKPDFLTNNPKQSEIRRRVILESYIRACSTGDRNLYLLEGDSFFRGRMEDDRTVDGCHPTDSGFRAMAESFIGIFERIIAKGQL